MASSGKQPATGGGETSGGPKMGRTLSRKMTRIQTTHDVQQEEDAPAPPAPADSELVPASLASIVPILRVANEIEQDNPRVAYLCRFHAFEKAHNLDPTSSMRGVRQFKTYLLRRLERDEAETRPQLARNDPKEIQKYYQRYYETYIKEGAAKIKPADMAKHYQILSVLHDVLKTVVPPERVEDEIKRYAKEVERKKGHFAQYNILPLHVSGASEIMELPEIRAALSALRKVDNLPRPRLQSTANSQNLTNNTLVHNDGDHSIHDLLDWLGIVFRFQKGNVANQREHLVLLLANIDIRKRTQDDYALLDSTTVSKLAKQVFKNYRSWCDYLHCPCNIKPSSFEASGIVHEDAQQRELLYIGLYFLIWGEASNIRFMPECLCYIFHHMANELDGILNSNVHSVTGAFFEPIYQGEEESFLQNIVTPIYKVLVKEVQRSRHGSVSHSRWRNYDDLNEYFWSKECFHDLGWPINPEAHFFMHPKATKSEQHDQNITGRRRLKTNFVEVRTFWHLFRSFERMWTFFILAFQAMLIIAWSPSGSLTAFFDPDVFRRVLSIFITAAFLNFFQATLDIILSWKAWGSKQYTQILRYLLKFAVATAWIIILSASYSGSIENPTGLIKLFSNWAGNWRNQSLYTYAIIIYMLPNIFSALLFLLPPLRRSVELSNSRVFILLMWWAQPKLYVGRGMHEDMLSLLKYTLFWILLLISKLAFSYYVEIYPLVEPTKMIMAIGAPNYAWHEFFPYLQHNIGVVITIWAPIVLVYFMDTQIWYAIFSTIFGGIHGAFSHLGEIRTLGMLRSRFETVPSVFTENLMPTPNEKNSKDQMERMNIAKFSHIWNEFISSLREEDLISNRERDLLLVPYSFGDISVVQWPPFLLASKIPIALDMAKDFKKKDDKELINKIKHDKHMTSAVIECYETLRDILKELLIDEHEKRSIDNICKAVESSITTEHNFLVKFRMSELPLLSAKLAKLLNLLKGDNEDVESYESQIVTVLQDIMEIITQDVMTSGHGTSSVEDRPKFSNLNLNIMEDASWKEKVDRLHLLLTIKESAIDVPINLDARRRITFFANSLFMDLPPTPKVRNMLSFSVLTPYYKEDVLYSEEELKKENEDGISTLFYLQKIYPDEWKNFLERVKFDNSENMDELRHWVSYRGQTLARTVRGMMYYRRALRLQCFLDTAKDPDILGGFRTYSPDENNQDHILARALAIADMKFTYVVSCQVYGIQKKSTEARDRSCYTNILNLMLNHHSLRVAYIDEAEETVDNKTQKCYYSVLVKGGDKFDEEIYRIKLPGKPTDIGEGKPENQNHAIIFTRGEALQTIDMNQDNYLEEAFKIRNVLGEFLRPKYQKHPPTILGLREHIFTGSVSSLAWFMSNQETSFVTIGQRILANPLKVRFHYGHPDIFDRIFHLTRGGISKASRIINLSEDIFSGFNSTLRGGNVTHHEYMQVGKGRDVGLNQISIFEAKVSKGNGEQTLSRDVYRLGRRFDFYRMLSFYFTTVGFYFSSMITVLTVYVFLYGRLYLVMSGLERSILEDPRIQQNNKPLENALASQSVFQLGLLLVLPMVMEVGLEKGFRTAIGEFIIMQLQLASVFFTFQLGTKAHYFGRTILHGGAKYSATGRGFVVFHAKFADNYRMYSRSHFVKGLELMILLVVYEVYGHSYRSSSLYLFVTMSMWFLVVSWLFAPFIFNPSGFEWQKTVDDWTDWKKWMGNRGGIGIAVDRSWESWWETEHEHLKSTSIRGRMLEIILALRFLIFQYGIVYHLNIAHNSRSVLVYGLSWLVMLTVLLVLKMVSMGRRGFGTDFQLMFRILKGLLFLGFVSVMTVLFVVCNLTLSDVFAALLGFMPTGWSILLIGQACRPLVRRLGFWDSIKELGRAYEYIMGMVIFVPIVVLSWFPFVSEFQTRLLFNQAFSRGLQISMILAGRKDSNMYGS
ncbi:callose synthase 7-like isoform X1 [Zingiber officinale]|uniref:callose synthase 7-like isoform X1 n=1 Tax=Zingiber officinale TaxID=94328 RepID=UPI001C4BA6CE|nr:callose synthase 7-like isoform X1 [Zingiber officinale]